MKIGIIGAGITGVTLAQLLSDYFIVDKARGVGGRLASRRLGTASIDHGIWEFIDPASGSLISEPHKWLKAQSAKLKIHNNFEVTKIENQNSQLKVVSLTGESMDCDKLVITTPAPQAYKILKTSGFDAPFLLNVKYDSAIQFMALIDGACDYTKLLETFEIKATKEIGDNQKIYLFHAKNECVPKLLEVEKEEIKKEALAQIQGKVLDSHAHKWRYSQVTTSISEEHQFHFAKNNILLAGDYFGNHGFLTSITSAKKVAGTFF